MRPSQVNGFGDEELAGNASQRLAKPLIRWSPLRACCSLGVAGLSFAGEHAVIEFVNYAGDVDARFAVGRDAVIFVDRFGAGIVSSQRKGEVIVVASEQ